MSEALPPHAPAHAPVAVQTPAEGAQQPVAPTLPETPRLSTRPAAVLLAIHAALLAYGAAVHSPTYNEPAHLVAGLSYWHFGTFEVYSVNPPLVRMVAAIPVLLAGCETNWSSFREGPGARPEMVMGSDFCEANGARTVWLITLARWACIPFSLLGGYTCFRWGRELYGAAAGLLALTLWCFCPNIIAHGQLITSDIAATACVVAACYMFWRWLKSPAWWNTMFSGLILGVAELAKTTLVVFYSLWPLLWLIYRWTDRRGMAREGWLREFAMLCTCLAIALYIVNVGYGFEGSLTKLGDFRFISQLLTGASGADQAREGGNRFADSWIADVPVPLPRNYVAGIDLQRKDFESYRHEFYLGGVWSHTGWWYYYLYAMAIKVPLGTWLLFLIATSVRLLNWPSAPFRDVFLLLVPAAVVLAVASSQTGMNEHMRYVLPILPFVFIWLGSVTICLRTPSDTSRTRAVRNLISRIAVVAVVGSTTSSLGQYPHSLSYFNEIIGGSRNGWKHLTNSNIDWGQDLLYLKQWSVEHPTAKPLRMALYGAITPKLAGIDGEVFLPYADKPELAPGWYAVSATILSGFGQPDRSKRLQAEIEQSGACETVGGSIFVFMKD